MLKKQTRIGQDIEEKILAMYPKGITADNIASDIQDISVSGSIVYH